MTTDDTRPTWDEVIEKISDAWEALESNWAIGYDEHASYKAELSAMLATLDSSVPATPRWWRRHGERPT